MRARFVKILTMSMIAGLLGIQPLSGQQLVQSFIEVNNVGNTNFGFSVSGAGDVNNDGYDDVIVGASDYDSNTGRAYVYYGGSSIDNTADVTMTGEGTDNYFGRSVSGAGDVNNDGYDDVIIGAYRYSSYTGRAYIYYGGSSMDATADVTMDGESSSYFGFSVSGAGDVNNDGYDDVIVGAYYYNSQTGQAYIYYGGSSMDSTADVTMDGESTTNFFGFSVSGAGDVNNDGYDDVIVGACGYNLTAGRAYVYYGSSSMDNTAAVAMTGLSSSYFGYSVSGAGNVNGDGYDDVIVGAYYYNSQTGQTYIYYGGSSMDATADVTMTGESIRNYFGRSVSGAGDVNNDGYDDVIVGAYRYSSYTGRAYIYYGGSSMDATADVTMDGESSSYFGFSVSGAGDVNNDGYDDVIVGAYYYSSGYGRAYVYYGGSSLSSTIAAADADVTMTGEGTDNYFGYSVSGAGDLNNDGYDDVIVGAYAYNSNTGRAYIYYGGSSMDATADVTMTGEGTENYFGCSVSGAGDVNGDGYDDVIVGANDYDSYTGQAYIYYGGSSMDATADVTMTGEDTFNYFGCSVSGAGDVNNDGYDDVIVGASWYDSYIGQAYIYYGSSSMDADADVAMTGEDNYNYFGCSVSGAGDVNNDGYDDVIVGASGYDSNTGQAYIYYGGSSMDATADVTMSGEGTDNYFGYSVSGAGYVNNDGYDDVIVGAYAYNSNTGRAYIYYGGSSMDATADVTMDGESSSYFGWSVSDAGDVNNDGYDDVIVGAHGYNSTTGQAYIYYGGSSMDATADEIITGENSGDCLGYSVSDAGDVNNNGYDDVIVGADCYPVNGKVYLYSDNSAPSVDQSLPVELTDFGVEYWSGGVMVSWRTESETENLGFIIERAVGTDSPSDWSEIASYTSDESLAGHGSTSQENSYIFTDKKVVPGKTYSYRLLDVDYSGKMKIHNNRIQTITVPVSDNLPDSFELTGAFPNPFNPMTTITFSVPETTPVQVSVFNIIGQKICTLDEREYRPGYHRITWNAQDDNGDHVPGGIYFVRIITKSFIRTQKVMLLK